MSTLTEGAELEAAIAEAELTDEEAELVKQLVEREQLAADEAVQAALATREPELELPAAPAELEQLGEPGAKQLEQLEREQARHEKRVHEIMGGHVAGFEACSECGGIGLVPPGPRPQAHPYFQACETCAGFGQVKTGSHRAGQEARDCPECKGRGYLEQLDEQGLALADKPGSPPAPTAFSSAPAAELAPATPPEQPAAPRFGTPAWMGDTSLGG